MNPPIKRRAPAFPLYADDFIGGTVDMAPEEVGAYIRLLCYQWNRGSIPVDHAVQVRLAGGCVSAAVLAKFSVGEDGNLRNERLEAVRAQKEKFHNDQSLKGRLSAEKRKNDQPRFNRGSTGESTAVQPEPQPNTQPEGQPKLNLPSPSPIKDIAPSSPWEVAFGLELPESLQTTLCLEAAKKWLAYKKERRQGYKPIGLQSTITKWANEFTAASFPSAVENSMASNWSGVFPNREQSAPQRQPVQSQPEGDYSKMNKEQRKNYEDWLLKQAL